MALSGNDGNTVERVEYDAYGMPSFYDANGMATSQSSLDNPILFTGREYNAELQNYHYRARAMHPGLGRFMQKDPLMYVDGMNDYSYVLNNPVNFIDPSGLFLNELSCATDFFDRSAEGMKNEMLRERIKKWDDWWRKVRNKIKADYDPIRKMDKEVMPKYKKISNSANVLDFVVTAYKNRNLYNDLVNSDSTEDFFKKLAEPIGDILGGMAGSYVTGQTVLWGVPLPVALAMGGAVSTITNNIVTGFVDWVWRDEPSFYDYNYMQDYFNSIYRPDWGAFVY